MHISSHLVTALLSCRRMCAVQNGVVRASMFALVCARESWDTLRRTSNGRAYSDQLSLVGAAVWLMGMVTCGLVRCWRRTPLWSDVDSPLRKCPSWLHKLSDTFVGAGSSFAGG